MSGETTGENVNLYGDPAGIMLPHSQLEAAVTQLWWQDKDPRDKRTATFPEIAIEPTFGEYVAVTDPTLQYTFDGVEAGDGPGGSWEACI